MSWDAIQPFASARDQVFRAQGYVEAIHHQVLAGLGSPDHELDKNLSDLADGLSTLLPVVRNILEQQDDTSEDKLLLLYEMVKTLATALEHIVARRDDLLEDSPSVSEFWTQDMHQRLSEILDELIDVEETLKIGLSPEARKDIAACRLEAGITPDPDAGSSK